MKILILEDSGERIRLFKAYLEKHDLHFFDNVQDAVEGIRNLGPFDVLFLDHDLDNRIYVDSDEPNTGYQLAKWIAENDVQFKKIILHTHNPAGARKMKSVLPQARIIPFTNLF